MPLLGLCWSVSEKHVVTALCSSVLMPPVMQGMSHNSTKAFPLPKPRQTVGATCGAPSQLQAAATEQSAAKQDENELGGAGLASGSDWEVQICLSICKCYLLHRMHTPERLKTPCSAPGINICCCSDDQCSRYTNKQTLYSHSLSLCNTNVLMWALKCNC